MTTELDGPVGFYLPLDLLAGGRPERWPSTADRDAAPCPKGHPVAHPNCTCGVAVWASADPPGVADRGLDRYRDRLGHRMRVWSCGLCWGAISYDLDRAGGLRAEHARILALGVAPDEAPPRLARAWAGARLLGAELVTVDGANTAALDQAIAAGGGRLLAVGAGASLGARLGERESAEGGMATLTAALCGLVPFAAGLVAGQAAGGAAAVALPVAGGALGVAGAVAGYRAVDRPRTAPERGPIWRAAAPAGGEARRG